jgi:Integrase core domain
LPIPDNAWVSIGMDFITGLPKSKGFEVILVVVDKLTKYGHFISLTHSFTASTVAQVFMDNIYKLYGLPTSIISDRDLIFTSRFWKELMAKLGVSLNISIVYHPQTDGQTEKLNQCLEMYLRAMIFDKRSKWINYLNLVEWWYNTTWHSAIKTTPFTAFYGYAPPMLAMASAPRSQVECVNEFLSDKQYTLLQLKENLRKAQERMRKNEVKNRSERKFYVGD